MDGKAWFLVGGRYIGINPDNFYASDFGTTGNAVVYDDPTYPDFVGYVRTWKSANVANKDAVLTAMLRDVVSGKAVTDMPAWLPAHGTVLLLSEVARNHTAFHTNLMAWDLIQKGEKLPAGGGTIDWTWENAIWIENACPDCGASGRKQPNQATQPG